MTKLSVCMVVKDEEDMIENAIRSVKGLADEIVVVDVGSADMTTSKARKSGAVVFDWKWEDDFAAARNFSISKAGGEWIVVLDADEALNPLDHSEIKSAIDQADKDVVAYAMVRRCYTPKMQSAGWKSAHGDLYPESKMAEGYSEDYPIRLFRNHKNIIFEGRINESVERSAREAGKIGILGMPIHCYRFLRDDGRGNMSEKWRLLREKIYALQEQEAPTAQLFWEHGCDLLAQQKVSEALSCFIKAVNHDKQFFPGWLSMANAYLIQGDNFKTRVALAKAYELNPNHYFIYLSQGILLTIEREFEQAIDQFMLAIKHDPDNAAIHYYLGLCFHTQGDREKAAVAFENACRLNPGYKEKIKFEDVPEGS